MSATIPTPVTWQIPIDGADQPHLSVTVAGGSLLFIVGQNGTGKSALLAHLRRSSGQHRQKWIQAHRQTWLNNDAIEITGAGRKSIAANIDSFDTQDRARFRDDQAANRSMATLFDLVQSENIRNREIAKHVDDGNSAAATKRASQDKPPIRRINELMRLAGLSVQLLEVQEDQLLVRHGEGPPFGLAKLSDGERNALLLAAEVLTVQSNTILLIDEPERHLHRSIAEPLLAALIRQRQDCYFVVATHELALPVAFPTAEVLLLRGCRWNGDRAAAWSIDVMKPGNSLPDNLRRAVFGARRRLLFTEGRKASLDRPMFSALFAGVSIEPVESCGAVIRSVKGLRASEVHHWLQAFGLIDRDDRTDEAVAKLASHAIFAIPTAAVEGLYYGLEAREAVASRIAKTFAHDAKVLLKNAEADALAAFSRARDHLVGKRVQRITRERLLEKIGSALDQDASSDGEIKFSFPDPRLAEAKEFDALHGVRSLDILVGRYDIDESAVPDAIARALKCPTRKDYEQAVIAAIADDADFGNRLRAKLGAIASALA